MKPILLNFCALFLLFTNLNHAADEREIGKKVVTKEFESVDKATEWKLNTLTLGEWVEMVSESDWTLLDKMATDDFYIAVFKDGDYLIFWDQDLTGKFKSSGFGLEKGVSEGPSKWFTLDYVLKYPTGKLSGTEQAGAHKIKSSHEGTLKITFTAKESDDEKSKTIYEKSVNWTDSAKKE